MNRRGFALIAVLWLLVAFGAIGIELGRRARAQRVAIANAAELARVRAAAEGGLEQLKARLSLGRISAATANGDAAGLLDPWRAAESLLVDADTIRFADARAHVDVDDVGSFVNLNSASEEQLQRLFGALRIDWGLADRLAQAIADWRDSDDLRRARGAELKDYRARGVRHGPGNRPFNRLAELTEVVGMTDATYQRIKPHLTLLGTGRVNVNAAPWPVLVSLPGFVEETADAVVRERRGGRPFRNFEELSVRLSDPARAALQANLVALNNTVVFDTREITGTSWGWLPGSPVRTWVRGHFVRAGDQPILVSVTRAQ